MKLARFLRKYESRVATEQLAPPIADSRNGGYGRPPHFHKPHARRGCPLSCKSGKHLLVLNFSHFDPQRASDLNGAE
jgi:hypothetical protein